MVRHSPSSVMEVFSREGYTYICSSSSIKANSTNCFRGKTDSRFQSIENDTAPRPSTS